MATLSSPGVGSKLEVQEIVSKLMTIERSPLKAIEQKETAFKAKITSLGLIKSALSSLQIASQSLNLSTTYNSVKPSVADASVFSAAVTGSTPPSSYAVEVKQLAQAQKLTSEGFASTAAALGTGTLKISIGSYADLDSPTASFTRKADTKEISIDIDATNNSLEGIRDAINSSDAGVTATIINDGSQYRLSLTSKETGEQNEIRISLGEGGDASLEKLTFDKTAGDTTGGFSENVAAKNAIIVVDGISITKASNTITDAIQGVTLTLNKEMAAGTTTKLTLTRDTSATKAAMENFVKAYNEVHKQIATLSDYNSATKEANILTGDATVRSIQTQLRQALSGAVAGAPVGMSSLSDIGISFQRDGTLAIDDGKLDKILADPNKDVGRLFRNDTTTGTVGYGSRLNSLVSSMIFGEGALINGRIDGINTSIKGLEKQRESQDLRLEVIEKRLYAQFTALDLVVSNMTRTSEFMTQQLEALKAQLS